MGASFQLIQYLVEQYPDSVKVKDDIWGWLPVRHYVSQCRYRASFAVIKYLVEQDPDSSKVKDNFGQLLLHGACERNEPLEVIQYLVERYPDALEVLYRTSTDIFRYTMHVGVARLSLK
jgi:hypothetical protein